MAVSSLYRQSTHRPLIEGIPRPQNDVIVKAATSSPVRPTRAVLHLAPTNELDVWRTTTEQCHEVIPPLAVRRVPVRQVRTTFNGARAQLMPTVRCSRTTR